jgi:hypothetical protein
VIPAATREGDWGPRMNVEIVLSDTLPLKIVPSLSWPPRRYDEADRLLYAAENYLSDNLYVDMRSPSSCQTT